MTKLHTKERGRPFAYETCPNGDLVIEYGAGKWRTSPIQSALYRRLIDTFRGRKVALGTSRDHPPTGSVGEWLQANVTKVAIAAYIGPILVHEGHADWEGSRTLRFR